jgi:predicted nucleic acid-binding protein
MKFVLDTNTVSALMQGETRIIERLARIDRIDVAVPQPVFAEIAYGVARLAKSKRKDGLRNRLELVRSELKTADWSDEVSDAALVNRLPIGNPGQCEAAGHGGCLTPVVVRQARPT